MAEENDSLPGKKRRVIHWNPEAGREAAKSRWTWPRLVLATVGGFFAVLIALGIVNRVARKFLHVEIFGGAGPAPAVAAVPENPNSTFVSQSKAELAFDSASKGLASLQQIPDNHPLLLQRMILIKKDLDDAQALMKSHEFAAAHAKLTVLNGDIANFGLSIKAKQEATKAKDAILLRIKDLEIARTLAPNALETALTDAGNGRKLLEEGNFLAAKEALDHGYAELKRAETAISDFVGENLLKGQQALTKGDKAGAKASFKAALEKAPGSEVATLGLKRAETIDRVFALLLQGEGLEKQSQFAAAAEAYQKAFALDGFSAAAQAGKERAARLEKETKFNTALAAAQAAMKAKDWAKAIVESQNALKVDAKKPEVQAMLKSARENEHREAVLAALNKAYAFENEHQWVEAHNAYDQTLKLEPDHADAKDGFIRSGTVIRALLQYKTYLENAQQLADRAEF
ncbi:MAG: hypothetical protein RLZZ15_3487, partial [Verrucomicrobiota bacterium]